MHTEFKQLFAKFLTFEEFLQFNRQMGWLRLCKEAFDLDRSQLVTSLEFQTVLWKFFDKYLFEIGNGCIGTGLSANGKLEFTIITTPTHPASSNNRL